MKSAVSIRILLFLSFSFLFISCTDRNISSVNLLTQARDIIEVDPITSLALLDSISCPECMDHDSYMLYIVTRVQAKYKTYQDITADTLIFQAQRYFEKKNDTEKKALTYIYTAAVYRERGVIEKALQSYLEAENYAKEINNDVLIIRCLQNTGDLYFIQNMMDSAIVRYKYALDYSYKSRSNSTLQLGLINLIGRSYSVACKLDSALLYFREGLDLANKVGDLSYESTFLHQLGITSRHMGDYNMSAKFLYMSLQKTTDKEEYLRLCLSFSILYNQTNQLDSAKIYVELMKEGLPTIKDNYVLKSMYSCLNEYNKKVGNYEEALYYANLYKVVTQKIVDVDNSEKLLNTEKAYKLSFKEKELSDLFTYIFLFISILIVVLVAFMVYFKTKSVRRDHIQEVEKNRLLEKQYVEKIESLTFLRNIYGNIASRWADICREVELLGVGTSNRPTIYTRIKQLIYNLQQNTNQKLILWAKDYLYKEPFGDRMLSELNDEDLLLFGLCCYGFAKADIADILNIPMQKVYLRKLSLKREFRKVGLSDFQIDKMLFVNNE